MSETTATSETGAVTGGVRALLRLEGVVLFAGMTLLYALWDGSWWVYAILFLAPDISFAAYLAGPRAGAIVYNAAHSYFLPVALMTTSLAMASAPGAVHRHDLARPYRHRPRARLRPEVPGRLCVHPSRPDRQGRGGLRPGRRRLLCMGLFSVFWVGRARSRRYPSGTLA